MDIEDLNEDILRDFIGVFGVVVEEDEGKTEYQMQLRAVRDFLYRPHRIAVGYRVYLWFQINGIEFAKFTW